MVAGRRTRWVFVFVSVFVSRWGGWGCVCGGRRIVCGRRVGSGGGGIRRGGRRGLCGLGMGGV